MKRLLLAAAVVAAFLVVAAAATADNDKKDGFKTPVPSMLIGVAPGSTTEAIISTGDMVGGYRFESIPDGISLRRHDNNRVEAFVNHETSLVPFPFPTPPTPTTEANSQNDFENSQVSLLTLSSTNAGVLQGSLAITSSENYQRFCSNFLATKEAGFNRPIFFTNEEGIDWVKRTGKSWPATIGAADSRQIGTVVAHDVLNGQTRPIWGMGRHNHENSLAVQGYGHPVVLSGDDSFVNDPAQSQVYSYIADSANDVMDDRGDLYAFVSDNPAKDDYFDFAPGDPTSVSGHFVKVPKDVATGRRADGTDLMAADKGYPLPPSVGWQRDAVTTLPIDGPQWVLEHWGDVQPQPAFQFVRIEDMAYDKRPGMENVVYLVDSGRGTLPSVTPPPGLARSTNGRVWKMVLDKSDPTKVLSLSIFIEGDDAPVKTPTEIHQPDNVESTQTGLLVLEDPGGSQQFTPDQQRTDPAATTARAWYVPFSGSPQIVAKINQSADEGPTDVDPADNPPFTPPAFPISPGNWGAWETTGVVDASSAFGPGSFLINIQAHTLWVEKAPGPDNNGDGIPDFTYKREGGQLLLLKIPGI